MSIEAVIVGDEEVRARFHRAAGEIDGKLADSMGRITIRLQAHVVRNKLSGQVLKVRTNNLRGSIHQEVIRDSNGIVGRVGTNVEYAAFHEYAFKKELKEPKQVVVRAHTRKLDYKGKSFLRTALKDQREEIVIALNEAVKEAMR